MTGLGFSERLCLKGIRQRLLEDVRPLSLALSCVHAYPTLTPPAPQEKEMRGRGNTDLCMEFATKTSHSVTRKYGQDLDARAGQS